MNGEKQSGQPLMTRTQSFIAASIFLSFFVLWFLFAAIGDSILCWINKNSGLASWIQALGVFFAFFVAYWSNQQNRRNDLLRRIIEKSEREISRLSYLKEDISSFKSCMRTMRAEYSKPIPPRNFVEQKLGVVESYRLTELPGLYFMIGIGQWIVLKNLLVGSYYTQTSNSIVSNVDLFIDAGEEFLSEFTRNIDKRINDLKTVIDAAERNSEPPAIPKDYEAKPLEYFIIKCHRSDSSGSD